MVVNNSIRDVIINEHSQSIVYYIVNKSIVYSPLECTTSTDLRMHTYCKLYLFIHVFTHSSKYAYKHTSVLSSIRQDKLHQGLTPNGSTPTSHILVLIIFLLYATVQSSALYSSLTSVISQW